MAGFGYDHPSYTMRRLDQGVSEVGATASADLYTPTAAELHDAHVFVATAGTATNAAVEVINVSGTATTTVGSATAGTSAAGTELSLDLSAPATLAAGSRTYAKTANDSTLAARVVWEWSADPETGTFA